jgi:hypothetical protein
MGPTVMPMDPSRVISPGYLAGLDHPVPAEVLADVISERVLGLPR